MDIVHSRYSEPMPLMAGYIETGRFSDFVDAVIRAHIEDKEFAVWLHKVHDKSFDDFRDSLKGSVELKGMEITKEQAGATINDSFDILKNFTPMKGGEKDYTI